jgi:hypothetical protein
VVVVEEKAPLMVLGGARQGLTLVNLSAQLETFLTRNTH